MSLTHMTILYSKHTHEAGIFIGETSIKAAHLHSIFFRFRRANWRDDEWRRQRSPRRRNTNENGNHVLYLYTTFILLIYLFFAGYYTHWFFIGLYLGGVSEPRFIKFHTVELYRYSMRLYKSKILSYLDILRNKTAPIKPTKQTLHISINSKSF